MKKPKKIKASSIELVDAKGKTRIWMDAGDGDGYATICLFSKDFSEDGRSIQISTQPNGALVIALHGKRCLASFVVNADEDGELSIRDRQGKLGTTLGSVFEPNHHRLILFKNGQPYWSNPAPKVEKKTQKKSNTAG